MRKKLMCVVVPLAFGGWAMAAMGASADRPEPYTLPPTIAVGMRVDTFFIGGFTRGVLREAVDELAGELSVAERTLIGEHLDRIFAGVVGEGGIGRSGRLRVVYERSVRPNGTTRAVRVLGAEWAVAGRLHTALYFERNGLPGYFDAFGRGLDATAWTGPLKVTRVNSGFGERRLHPILGRVLPHTGVDLAAEMGEPVYAAADGVVLSAANRGGYGLLVEVLHSSGYSTRYAHLSRLGGAITARRPVRRGEVLGYTGMSGLATGPHLHYEVRRRGQPIDPQGILGVAAPAADLAGEPAWPMERRRLSALLSRAPTVHRAPRTGTTLGL